MYTYIFLLNTQVYKRLPAYPAWFHFKLTKTPKFATTKKTLNKRHEMKGKREKIFLQLAEFDFVHQIEHTRHLKLKGKFCTIHDKSQNELVFNPKLLFIVKISIFYPHLYSLWLIINFMTNVSLMFS